MNTVWKQSSSNFNKNANEDTLASNRPLERNKAEENNKQTVENGKQDAIKLKQPVPKDLSNEAISAEESGAKVKAVKQVNEKSAQTSTETKDVSKEKEEITHRKSKKKGKKDSEKQSIQPNKKTDNSTAMKKKEKAQKSAKTQSGIKSNTGCVVKQKNAACFPKEIFLMLFALLMNLITSIATFFRKIFRTTDKWWCLWGKSEWADRQKM